MFFNIEYGPADFSNGVVMTAHVRPVPEPGSIALVTIGLMGLG